MAEPKTKPTTQSVAKFIETIKDAEKRQDCFALVEIMKQASRSEPKMWGSSIVGFGSYHYQYAGGREADWPLIGFSPRKQNLTLYIMPGFEQQQELLNQLGKHSTGKSCLYIKRLSDIDLPTLKKLVQEAVRVMQKKKA